MILRTEALIRPQAAPEMGRAAVCAGGAGETHLRETAQRSAPCPKRESADIFPAYTFLGWLQGSIRLAWPLVPHRAVGRGVVTLDRQGFRRRKRYAWMGLFCEVAGAACAC